MPQTAGKPQMSVRNSFRSEGSRSKAGGIAKNDSMAVKSRGNYSKVEETEPK